ncbi:MAG: hypothetical protein ACK5JH_08170 [Anaerocolumna sp.]
MKNKSSYSLKKSKKQIVSIAIILCILTLSFAGCGKKTESTENNTSSTEDTGKEKITIALQTNSFITDYDDNYFTKLLEEEMGVDIEIYQLPTDTTEMKTKMSLMISSGDDLPDVFCTYGIPQELILDYGSKGVFIPLNDYINNPDIAVNFNNIAEEDKDAILKSTTSADGNIYSLAKYEPMTWNLTPYRMYINESWLNKLNLKVPTTTEEYYEVLKAFVNNDPNGNGIKDEIGVYGLASGGYGEDMTIALMNSFVFYRGGGQLSLAEDGKTVIAPYATEGWKKGLEYMAKLYNDGLLSASIFTDDTTQFKAVLNNESANIVGSVSAGSTGNWTDANTNPNFAEMELLSPLSGPDGIAYTSYTPYTPEPTWYITSSCKNPELAVKLGDLFYKQNISMSARYGEEDVDWSMKEEVVSQYTTPYIEMGIFDKVTAVDLSNLWTQNTNKFWHNIGPRYVSNIFQDGIATGTADYNPEIKTEQLKAKNYVAYLNAHPENVLSGHKYTREETEKITEAATNIPNFIKQSLAEFVTGARSLEDWDKYLEELNNMGLKEYIECTQAAYDRIEK